MSKAFDWRLWGSALVLTLVGASLLFAHILTPYSPIDANFRNREAPPSITHPFGTDGLGRDVLARVLYGGRVSLLISTVGVSLYMIIGVVLGAVSGYFGGQADFVIQRLTDMMLAFPPVLIVITFLSFSTPGLTSLFLSIGLLNWAYIVRLVRAEVLSLRTRLYVDAARSLGASDWRILRLHILPGLMPLLVVTAAFGVADAILIETSISFLGLGVAPPTATWGGMIYDATSITTLEQQPWVWLPPGIAIIITVLAVNFLGDALLRRLKRGE